MKKIVLSFFLALLATSIQAQDGRTVYNFLRLPVSAHGAALGGNNISLVEDDESMIFHNPSLLSNVSDKTILINYMNYMAVVRVPYKDYLFLIQSCLVELQRAILQEDDFS